MYPRCQAAYDQYGGKQCVLPDDHDGKHRAEWMAEMEFDYDYRDPAGWLD